MPLRKLKGIDVTAWMPTKIRRWAFPAVLFLLSAVMFFLADWAYRHEGEFPPPSSEASGEVIRIKFKGFLSCPVVRFSRADGQQVTFQGHICSNPPSHTVGQHLVVRYTSDLSQQPYIASEPPIQKAFIPALFGALWFGLGALLTYRRFQQK
jgi:hypothetical protein